MTASAISVPQRNIVSQAVPTILLIGSFWLSCIFYSVGYNLLMLQLAVAGPLLCLLIAGPQRLWLVIQSSRRLCAFALGTIGLVCLHYSLFSISPEASYPYAWVVTSIPLWVLALSVMTKPHFVAIGIAGSVLIMALISDVRFVLDGQRAYDPLADTNNYASLIYLTLIPANHYLLLRLWQRSSSALYVALVGLNGLLCLALFATVSRTGSVILVAAVVAWSVWAFWHRLDLKPVVAIIVVIVFDYWLFGALSPELQTAALESTSLQTGMSVRWSMLESAFQIARDTGFIGTGLFTFSLLYPAYRSLDDQSTSGVLVHNDYVQLLVEGGPLLLFPLGVLVVATIIVLWRSLNRAQGLSFRHGCALALAAVLAHAMVNFVFYSLVLCVAVAVLSFFAFADEYSLPDDRSHSPSVQSKVSGLAIWVLGVGFGCVAWFFLALDTYAFAVFSGQPSIPSAQAVRSDADKALEYARYHQALNSNRSIPALGEALLLARHPYTEQSRQATLEAFRRALKRYPWSVQARLGFVDYVITHRIGSRYLQTDEQPEQMLLATLRDMPADLAVIRQLARYYKLVGQPEKAVEQIRTNVFPWMELLYRRDPDSYAEVRAMILDLVPANNAVQDELQEMAELLERVERDYHPDVWFKRWRAASSS